MSPDTERRGHERNNVEAPIVFAEWKSKDYREANLCDFSKSGMSFESETLLRPGADVSIKVEAALPEIMGEKFPGARLHGEVIWCKECEAKNVAGYAVGVKYFKRFWEKSYDEGITHLPPEVWEVSYPDLIRSTFEEFSKKPAFHYMGVSVTFAELDLYSNRFADMLLANDFIKGDVVGINLPNIPEYIIAWLGTLKAGCVVSGVSPLLSNEEMAYQLKDSNAKGLVTLDAIFAGRLVHIERDLPNLTLIVAASVGGFMPGIKRMLGKIIGKIPTGRVTPLVGKKVYNINEVIHTEEFFDEIPGGRLFAG